MPLRAGGTAGFCFVAVATPSGFAVPPRNKTKNEVSWLPRKKQPLAWRAGPTRFECPARGGAEKEKNMTEEIKTRQTEEETTSAIEPGQRADTGSARYGARERQWFRGPLC